MASRCENRPPCRYSGRPVSDSSATAASSAEAGSCGQRCRRPARSAPAPAAAGGRAGRRRAVHRQPGDRAVGLRRQLGAQRDLQIGEPVVAEGLREPQHGRRADLGAFGEPGGAGQAGARIVGEQRAADPCARPCSATASAASGPCRHGLRRSSVSSGVISGSVVIDRSCIEIGGHALRSSSGCQSRSPNPVDADHHACRRSGGPCAVPK